MRTDTIIILTVCAIITVIFAIYNFMAVPVMMYGGATIGFLFNLKQEHIKLSPAEFLNRYRWSYFGVSALLILLAGVNSIGYHNRAKEYHRCCETAINDTVIALDRRGKMGNMIKLANGETYGVFIAPLTKVIEVENIIRKNKNRIILKKKANNDTIIFIDSYGYTWTFPLADPSLKTIFEKSD